LNVFINITQLSRKAPEIKLHYSSSGLSENTHEHITLKSPVPRDPKLPVQVANTADSTDFISNGLVNKAEKASDNCSDGGNEVYGEDQAKFAFPCQQSSRTMQETELATSPENTKTNASVSPSGIEDDNQAYLSGMFHIRSSPRRPIAASKKTALCSGCNLIFAIGEFQDMQIINIKRNSPAYCRVCAENDVSHQGKPKLFLSCSS